MRSFGPLIKARLGIFPTLSRMKCDLRLCSLELVQMRAPPHSQSQPQHHQQKNCNTPPVRNRCGCLWVEFNQLREYGRVIRRGAIPFRNSQGPRPKTSEAHHWVAAKRLEPVHHHNHLLTTPRKPYRGDSQPQLRKSSLCPSTGGSYQPYFTILYFIVLYHTILYCMMPYYTLLYSTLLYSTLYYLPSTIYHLLSTIYYLRDYETILYEITLYSTRL